MKNSVLSRILTPVLIFTLLLSQISCMTYREVVENPEVKSVQEEEGYKCEHPAEVELFLGRTVHYPSGFEVRADTIRTIGYFENWRTSGQEIIREVALADVHRITVQYEEINWISTTWKASLIVGIIAVYLYVSAMQSIGNGLSSMGA